MYKVLFSYKIVKLWKRKTFNILKRGRLQEVMPILCERYKSFSHRLCLPLKPSVCRDTTCSWALSPLCLLSAFLFCSQLSFVQYLRKRMRGSVSQFLGFRSRTDFGVWKFFIKFRIYLLLAFILLFLMNILRICGHFLEIWSFCHASFIVSVKLESKTVCCQVSALCFKPFCYKGEGPFVCPTRPTSLHPK